MLEHCYIQRESNKIVKEDFFQDALIRKIYSNTRESSSLVLKFATQKWVTDFLGLINYDIRLSKIRIKKIIKKLNIDTTEFLDDVENFKTVRDIFERKIKFWQCRQMEENLNAISSPCDAKMLIGTLKDTSLFFIKEKFFEVNELFKVNEYIQLFKEGDFSIFRLTPEEYHYNHAPVSGRLIDIYQIDGTFHSCNPYAVSKIVTPYSKNKRVISIIDTDVPYGSQIGKVAMIEIAAMMIGDICQCYSERDYSDPKILIKGMFLKKGSPKSLFRPGSSTTILFFQKDKVVFCEDLMKNSTRTDVPTRYLINFHKNIVETKVKVRSTIAYKR